MMTRDTLARQTPGGIVLPLPSPLMAMLPPEVQGRKMQTFFSNVTVANIAHNAQGAGTLQVDPNYDLAIFIMTADVWSSDNQTPKPNDLVTVGITDTGTKNFTTPNVPTSIRNLFGTGVQPKILAVPLFVPGNTGLNFSFSNQSNADALTIYVTLEGVLISKRGR